MKIEGFDASVLTRLEGEVGYVVLRDVTDGGSLKIGRFAWEPAQIQQEEAEHGELVKGFSAWAEQLSLEHADEHGAPRTIRALAYLPKGARQLASFTWRVVDEAPEAEEGEVMELDLSPDSTSLGQTELLRAWATQLQDLQEQSRQAFKAMNGGFAALLDTHVRSNAENRAHLLEAVTTERQFYASYLDELKQERAEQRALVKEILSNNAELMASIVNLHRSQLEKEHADLEKQRAELQAASSAAPADALMQNALNLTHQWVAAQAGLHPQTQQALQRPEVQAALNDPRLQGFLATVTPQQLDMLLTHLSSQ